MRRPPAAVLLAGAALLVGAARYALRAPLPDDYDSVGFALALDDFDLARYQPHFPGYPVYVALGRLAHVGIGNALDAAEAVSAAAAAATGIALWWAVRRLASERAAWVALACHAAAALPWLLGGAALSDGTATALAAVAFAALLDDRPWASGVCIALMLGARVSYFPLALSWAAALWLWRRASWRRALAGGAIGLAAWAVPFVAVVGARNLLALGLAHGRGHFADWGGSIVTRPALAPRLFSFARDLFFDGLAPTRWALPVLALLVGIAAWQFRGSEAPAPARRMVPAALLVAVPYAAWALFGQNIIEQPRHVLPLVVLAIAAMAIPLAHQPWIAFAAVLVMLAAASPLAWAHHVSLPAAVQAARHAAATYPPAETAVFGARSIRLVHFAEPALAVRERHWLAEVDVDLARMQRLPRHILITSEIEQDPRRSRHVSPGPRFCRDPRLDRREPCLQLFEYLPFEATAR